MIADATFFSCDFGVLVLLDSLTRKVIYHQIIKTEKDVYYKIAMKKLREKGYFPYKHHNIRSAYISIKLYFD